MSEPTLARPLPDLNSEVGFNFGFGRGADYGENAWDASQVRDISSIVKSGLHTFYYPYIDGLLYDWSFLRPVGTVTLESGNRLVNLPDDCGGLEGGIQVTDAEERSLYRPVKQYNEAMVRQAYATYDDAPTGWPSMVAKTEPKEMSKARSQRSQLYVYPQADQDYTFRFNYYVVADALTDAKPYAYGGAAHAETILAACLAAGELRVFGQGNGPFKQNFQERLLASVAFDRRNKPQSLGYNGDRSDDRQDYRGYRRRLDTITFDGVDPTT